MARATQPPRLGRPLHERARLAGGVFPGGCFWAAAAAEFDGRPGPVPDAVRDGTAAWLGELERQARAAGAEDPRQLAFELHALALGANSSFQLFGDRQAFRRARRAWSGCFPEGPPAAPTRRAPGRSS